MKRGARFDVSGHAVYPCQADREGYIGGFGTPIGVLAVGGCWMGQACEVCGKSAQMGNQVTTRGRAKYLGGVGTKVTGISRRKFKPNLRRVRISTPNGTHKTVSVCAQCLRSGTVTRLIHVAPFRVPSSEKPKGEAAHAVAAEGAAGRAPAQYVPPEGAKIRKRKRKKDEPAG